MSLSGQIEASRNFWEVARELSLLTADESRRLAAEAKQRGILPSQLAMQRGALTATQIDIVETLLAPREAVPGYETLGLVGYGGMGVVYRARQLALQREVALKTVLLSQLADPSALKRFEQEATLAARLAHPHIVTVYDFGRHAGRLFYAMELVEGEDAERLVLRTGPLDERLAWLLVRQAASGLAHAQELGIVHRDIKPANLLLVQPPAGFPLPAGTPLVKIADFGLARLAHDDRQRTRLTADATAVGSLLYMAPEQLEAEASDERADLYALGATAYHLLAGRPPLAGLTSAQIMAGKLTGRIPDVREQRAGVSAASAELVAALLALDPKQRPAPYAALIERIDRLPLAEGGTGGGWHPLVAAAHTATLPVSAAPTSPAHLAPTQPMPSARGRRRHIWRRAAAGVGILAVIAIAVAAWLSWSPSPGERDLVPTGRAEYLFDGRRIDQWLPLSGGWYPQTAEEGGLVLEGTGDVRRGIAIAGPDGKPAALAHYRLILFLYLREAAAVEVQFDLASGERAAPRQLVQITAAGSRLGRRAGDRAPLVLFGPTTPLATRAEQPHVVQIERHTQGWWVFVDDKLVGAVRGQHEQPAGEFRVHVEGQSAWISDVTVEELGTE